MATTATMAVIADRFYAVIDKLIEMQVLRGVATFTTKYGIDRRNFLRTRATHSINVVWLMIVARDYNVSTDYLLLGIGGMFRE